MRDERHPSDCADCRCTIRNLALHLTDLGVDGDVAPSTQDQAFYALLFLFEHVLNRDFGKINAIRSTKAARIPTV